MEVVERSCGECTMCCKVPAIKELDKPQDTWCQYCEIKKGCKIYGQSERPESCVGFKCLWLQGIVPEELRPDKTHVVLGPTTDSKRIMAWVDLHRPEAYRRGLVRWYLVELTKKGIDVVIIIGNRRVLLSYSPETLKKLQESLDKK